MGDKWKRVVLGIALTGVLAMGYVGAGYGASSAPAVLAGPTDTEPTPEPEPAPDPAPPAAKPTPKPAPKPAPKPTPKAAPQPARTYRAPTPVSPQPAYQAPRVTTHTKPKVAPKRHKKKVKPAVTPKPKTTTGQVQATETVEISGIPTAATVPGNGADGVRRGLVIGGIGMAALLFLLVVAIPATAMRFSAPGRIVMDHQTDLVLTGIATLLLTALLFVVTK